MFIFGYLRASTNDQDAQRARKILKGFAQQHGHRIAGWYAENASGASLQRPVLLQLLHDAEPGDAILIEQVDRLSRLDEEGWRKLKEMIQLKSLSVISLDLPTSHIALSKNSVSDQFTKSMLKAINNMMLDMLAAISRKDYEDRRRRQKEGIDKARSTGAYPGRQPDLNKHELIKTLRLINGKSINETAKLANVSRMTVIRVCKNSEY